MSEATRWVGATATVCCALLAGVAAPACSDNADGPADGGADASGLDGGDGLDGGPGLDGDPGPSELGWRAIPDFPLVVGLATRVDLREFLDDPNGPSAITLDGMLPAGLSFTDGVIEGTPTEETPGMRFTATAEDETSAVAESDPFTIEVAAPAFDIELERATPEQIGLYIPLATGVPAEASARVRYRATGEATWRSGHPLVRIHPEWTRSDAPEPIVDAFAGTIFDLTPGSSYEVEVTLEPLDGGAETVRTVLWTRALPGPSTAVNKRADPSSDLQATLDALSPGDVLELEAGTYDVDTLRLDVSGTADEPITIRGAERDGVVLRNPSRVLLILDASHVVIENLTIEGSGTDSETDASSHGVAFGSEGSEEFVTFRRVSLRGVDQGIISEHAVHSILVYDSVLEGNNAWVERLVESNRTWNDDGLRLPGEGNCAFNNSLRGFGDSLAVGNGELSAAVHFYRNRITASGDDAIEGDYSTRNVSFYDNHITNSSTFVSLDPLWGGPFYVFRNISINTVRGPFKLNSEQSGFVVYNNTIIRTEGTTGWAWVQYDNGALRNFSYRNNITIYHGDGNLMALEPPGIEPVDFTHNAWFPDGPVWWTNSGGSFGSLDDARDALDPTTPMFGTSTARHEADEIVSAEPFETPVPLGEDHLDEVTTVDYVPRLEASSPASGSGDAIPNITDGFSGDSPDRGAVIRGRPVPEWGPRM